jgi:hypothetical protein
MVSDGGGQTPQAGSAFGRALSPRSRGLRVRAPVPRTPSRPFRGSAPTRRALPGPAGAPCPPRTRSAPGSGLRPVPPVLPPLRSGPVLGHRRAPLASPLVGSGVAGLSRFASPIVPSDSRGGRARASEIDHGRVRQGKKYLNFRWFAHASRTEPSTDQMGRAQRGRWTINGGDGCDARPSHATHAS